MIDVPFFVLATILSTAEEREGIIFRAMSYRVCWMSVLYVHSRYGI